MDILDLDCVTDAARGAVLLHPLRARILRAAQQPVSATDVARQLGLGRQQVNYHVRELARARFLRRAGRRRKRNMIEQRYVATARGYVLAPAILRPLGLDPATLQDGLSADRLLALAASMQGDVAAAMEGAQRAGKRLSTLSIASDVRFDTPRQRAAFAAALQQAITQVIARHTSPAVLRNGQPGSGRLFRFVVGCYPAGSREER